MTPELRSSSDHFAVPEENVWSQDNAGLIYKTGHSFYGDPGLFRLDQSALDTLINVSIALFGLVIFIQFVQSLGTTFNFFKKLLTNVETGRAIMNDPKMLDLANLVLTSVEKYYKLNAAEEAEGEEEEEQ